MKLFFTILFLSFIFLSCNNDVLNGFVQVEVVEEEMTNQGCQTDSIILKGKWTLGSYYEILNDEERILYQSTNPSGSNYYPDDINGELNFDDSNYQLDLNMVFKRSQDSVDFVHKQSSGGYWYNSVCSTERCIGFVRFFDFQQNIDIVDSMSQVCSDVFNIPLLIWTKHETDSLLLYWTKEE